MNGVLHAVAAGDTVIVPAGARHGLRAITPLELIIIELVTSSDVGIMYVFLLNGWGGKRS